MFFNNDDDTKMLNKLNDKKISHDMFKTYNPQNEYNKNTDYKQKKIYREYGKFEIRKELNEKDKLFKLIRYIIIGILILFGIYVIIQFYPVNRMVNEATPIINDIKKMTKDTIEANKKIIEKLIKDLQIDNNIN